MELGSRLKTLRGGLSQEEFSQRVGFNKNTIGNYERGERTPDAVFIKTVCEKLGVSAEWLLWGHGPMRRGEVPETTAQDTIQSQPPPVPPPGDDFKMTEMVTMTVEVLESETIYRTALASNIRAFHQAVRSERTLARLEERMEQIEQSVEELKRENRELKQQKHEQSSQSKAVGA